MSSRRGRGIAAAAVVLGLGAAGLAIALSGSSSARCAAVVGAADVPPVFASLQAPVVRTDPNLQRLITAVQGSGFGRVLGAVGYDQTHWLHSAAVPGGFASWTADNAVIGFRDPAGRVRWGLRQSSDQQAWAVVGDKFLDLDLRPGRPLRVGAYAASDGSERWCAQVARPTRSGEPLTVARGAQGSVWVVTAGPTLSRLDAHGKVLNQKQAVGVDRGASVLQLGSLLVVGGRASHLLAAPDPTAPPPAHDAFAVTGFDVGSLGVRWRWGRGLTVHVLGAVGESVVVEIAKPGGIQLVSLDLSGRPRWAVDLPAGTTADTALRAGTVVVRSARTLSGYDATSGAQRWTRPLPPSVAFPLGFDLAVQPSVGDRMLLGMTSGLVILDPRTGRSSTYALPAGASATFWPYETVVSADSAIVETNAGAVLVALRPR